MKVFNLMINLTLKQVLYIFFSTIPTGCTYRQAAALLCQAAPLYLLSCED